MYSIVSLISDENDLLYASGRPKHKIKTVFFDKKSWMLELPGKLTEEPKNATFSRNFPYRKNLIRLDEYDQGPRISPTASDPVIPMIDSIIKSTKFYNSAKYYPQIGHTLKYFIESPLCRHADHRYYRTRARRKSVRAQVMKEILFAFSLFSQQHKIVSWLAHGTLLGWYWNQEMLPWDEDIDLQMTYNTLLKLSETQNNTLLSDRFLIDINPNSIKRNHEENNIIDGRIIDTSSGLFIDITAVAPSASGTVACKSPHSYKESDLYPLHATIFEGVAIYRPHHAMEILKYEYGEKALVLKNYRGHRFDAFKEKWVEEKMINKQIPS